MRVIAGQAGGLRLESPPQSAAIRPTLDRVREAVFSILGERVIGANFLDLFAGTGANGIEALSRGAQSATFVDDDNQSLKLIERNLTHTRLAARARVVRLTLPRDLSRVPGRPFDIVYADPPHGFAEWDKVLELLGLQKFLQRGAWVIYEHGAMRETPDAQERVPPGVGLRPFRTAVYGKTALTFYTFDAV